MKKLLVIFLALTFVLAMISLAFGSRYNEPMWGTAGNPAGVSHGGYADTTDKCKDCHAVHLAQGSYKILRPGTTGSATGCDYCHGSGTGSSYNSIYLNTSGHGPGGSQTAPDDKNPPFSSGDFGCAACHSVHDRNTIGALTNAANRPTSNSARMLKADPDTLDGDTWTPVGATVTMSRWCMNCHSANYGTYGQQTTVLDGGSPTAAYGHGAGATAGISIYAPVSNTTVAVVRSNYSTSDINTVPLPRCNQCHAAGAAAGVGASGWVSGQSGQVPTGGTGINNVNFPHTGYVGGFALLKSSANINTAPANVRLDDVCNDCHYTPSLP